VAQLISERHDHTPVRNYIPAGIIADEKEEEEEEQGILSCPNEQ
jgi:hypothetical protein